MASGRAAPSDLRRGGRPSYGADKWAPIRRYRQSQSRALSETKHRKLVGRITFSSAVFNILSQMRSKAA
jgi:hypothetical protein